jgi:hypothetical protein
VYKESTILEDVSITTKCFIDDYYPFDFATKDKVDHFKGKWDVEFDDEIH